jgi:hypothetical protein
VLDTVATPAGLADFVPLAERALSVDAASMIRFRSAPAGISGFVRLPYEVLAGRTLAGQPASEFDVTVSAADFVRWQAGSAGVPAGKDAHWLTALPPRRGWNRIEVVPDGVIRNLIRSGAELAAGASSRQSQESLLTSVVLTATNGQVRVEVPLGPLSALTRMGFLPRGSEVALDLSPGWIRVAAALGSAFVQTGRNQLGLLSL